mmetsp:Transcript_9574/g.17786  ORF Transcript_9574/g.17786 Transcript_9574/m.17786 type:complete len:216 (+) Transcript_9574:79-726(+)
MNGGGPWYGSNAGSYNQGGGYGGGDFGGGSYTGYGSYGNGFGASWNGGKGMKGDGGKGGGKASTMCKFYLAGNCTRGASCFYSHGDAGGSKDWCSPAPKPQAAYSGDADDPDLQEIQDAIASMEIKNKDKDDEAELMAEMEREEMEEQPGRDNDTESEGSDALPPPATPGEIAEAQEIVRKAQDDLIERNKMKAKVKDATQNDLQAMINARLAKR